VKEGRTDVNMVTKFPVKQDERKCSINWPRINFTERAVIRGFS
jgi:hypothetical protein